MSAADHALSCRGVTVRFGDAVVLDGLDLDVAAAETVALLGPSGSGKTTLLYAIAGLLQLDDGEITIGGAKVADRDRTVPPEQRSVGMVFQNYALWPHLTAQATVEYPLLRRGADPEKAATAAARLLETLGVAQLAQRHPDEMSGGQQQRVGLARALAAEPRLYLFDEPTAHLDAGLRTALQSELMQQSARTGAAALYTTHDASEAMAVADRVAVLRRGQIVQAGPPQLVYDEPVDEWTAVLTGPASIVSGRILSIGDGMLVLEVEGRTLGVEGGVVFGLEEGAATLVVRPDWVELEGPMPGTVAGVRFDGPHTDYVITTPLGEVRVRRPGPPVLSVGDVTGWTMKRAWAVAAASSD